MFYKNGKTILYEQLTIVSIIWKPLFNFRISKQLWKCQVLYKIKILLEYSWFKNILVKHNN